MCQGNPWRIPPHGVSCLVSLIEENLAKSGFQAQMLWLVMPMVGIKWWLTLLLCILCFIKSKYIRIFSIFAVVTLQSFIGNYTSMTQRLYLFIPMLFCFVIIVWCPFKYSYRIKLQYLLFAWGALFITDVVMQPGWISLKYFFVNKIRILTIALIISVILVLRVFIKKTKICFYIIYNTLFLFGAVNYWVYAITGQPFVLSDIGLAKTAFGVMQGVDIALIDAVWFFVCLLFVAGFNIAIHQMQMEDAVSRYKNGMLAALVFGVLFLVMTNNTIEMLGYMGNLKYGFVGNFILNMDLYDRMPSGYDEILEVEDFPDNITRASNGKPNILIIMNESFCDLREVGNFKTSKEYLPFTSSLRKTCPSGITYASVWGNNTVSTEFSVLTGIPTSFVGAGADIYQKQLSEGTQSIVTVLNDIGYYTVGIHPYDGDGYNRRTAWKNLGFDACYFEEDFKDAKNCRKFISDQSAYEKLVSECKSSEQPFFGFLTTMQNHATYSSGMETDIQATSYDYPDVNEYLTLSNISDGALRKLIAELDAMERPTYLLYFGDHQPMIDKNFYSDITGTNYQKFTLKQQSMMYKVPYILYSNRVVSESVPKSTLEDVPEEISMNYLPAILLKSIGVENGWFSYVYDRMEEYPVITDHFYKIDGRMEKEDTVMEALSSITGVLETRFYDLKKYQIFSWGILKGVNG